jgi:hypothetical protein
MNNPKRYEPSSHYSADFGMAQQINGKWVSYEDYARLSAKVEALEERIKQGQIDIERVQAQSEFYRSKLINETAYTANVQLLDQVKHLESQVERLAERNKYLSEIDSYLQSANLNAEEQRSLELEAQVERLIKAGGQLDDVVRSNLPNLQPEMHKAAKASIEAWYSAKE